MNFPSVNPASMSGRTRLAKQWLAATDLPQELSWRQIAGDASFRSYYRLQSGSQSWILMDAPPEKEDCAPFLSVQSRLHTANIRVPRVLAHSLEHGLILLEDFGDQLLRESFDVHDPSRWTPALFELLTQLTRVRESEHLPAYDRALLLQELELFPSWYLRQHCRLELGCDFLDLWEALCTRLINNALEQPQVFVHRDFHSCNLMIVEGETLGLIDFQDAVRGAITYDFASLIWDRYIHWPRAQLEDWMEEFRTRVAANVPSATWVRWCDWMGLQRNLKIVGIFARLHYRDGKKGYLEMIPQFWSYVDDVLRRYPEFSDFHGQLEQLKCAP